MERSLSTAVLDNMKKGDVSIRDEVKDLNRENIRMKKVVSSLSLKIIEQNEQVRKLEKEIEQLRDEREKMISSAQNGQNEEVTSKNDEEKLILARELLFMFEENSRLSKEIAQIKDSQSIQQHKEDFVTDSEVNNEPLPDVMSEEALNHETVASVETFEDNQKVEEGSVTSQHPMVVTSKQRRGMSSKQPRRMPLKRSKIVTSTSKQPQVATLNKPKLTSVNIQKTKLKQTLNTTSKQKVKVRIKSSSSNSCQLCDFIAGSKKYGSRQILVHQAKYHFPVETSRILPPVGSPPQCPECNFVPRPQPCPSTERFSLLRHWVMGHPTLTNWVMKATQHMKLEGSIKDLRKEGKMKKKTEDSEWIFEGEQGVVEQRLVELEFVECDQRVEECDQRVEKCEQGALECERGVVECEQGTVEYEQGVVEYKQGTVECEQGVVECDQEVEDCERGVEEWGEVEIPHLDNKLMDKSNIASSPSVILRKPLKLMDGTPIHCSSTSLI